MQRRNRFNRDSEEFDDDEGRRMGAGREGDWEERSRRRDLGNYGRAYGSYQHEESRRDRDDEDGPRRGYGGGYESRRPRMGWGRRDDEGEEGGRSEERQGYWSQSHRGEFGGRGDYGRGNEDRYGRGDYEDEFRERRGRGGDDAYGGGRGGARGGPYERERSEGSGMYWAGRRSRGYEDDEDDERGNYVGGRHVGSNIGQSQIDYNEDYYRRGGRGGSRWEDEDVVTRRGSGSRGEDENGGGRMGGGYGRGQTHFYSRPDQGEYGGRNRGRQMGDGGRYSGGGGRTYDLDEEERGGRRSGTSGRSSRERSENTRTSQGRSRTTGGDARMQKRGRKRKASATEETTGGI